MPFWRRGSPAQKVVKPVADVLFGKYNPSAKLPVTFPRNLGQVPIFYGTKSTGRPFNPADPAAKYKSTYLIVRTIRFIRLGLV